MNNVVTKTCRTCKTEIHGACAWCPTCQAARLDAAQARMIANPTPKQPKTYANGSGVVCRSQVRWCR